MNKTLLPTLAAALALFGSAGTASAALLSYEGFDYNVGTNFGNFGDANGGTGFGSPWYSAGGTADRLVAGGSLSYPASVNYTPTGAKGGIATTGEFFAQTGRNLDSSASLGASTAGTRYISFLINTSNLSAYNQYGLGQDGSGNSVTFGFDSGQFTVEATGAGKVFFGSPITGSTYLFVAKIANDGANSIASVSVFGSGDTVPGSEGSWQATTSSFGSVTLNRFYGFQGQNSTVQLDEIRIGDSYADVVSVAAVPEPASAAALAGAALLGFAALRRRRPVA